MEQKAKQDCASEITFQYDAVRLNPKGNCRTDGSRGSTAVLNVCTYNVRTLRAEDDQDKLIDEADQIKWDVNDLCEAYRKGEGLPELKGAC